MLEKNFQKKVKAKLESMGFLVFKNTVPIFGFPDLTALYQGKFYILIEIKKRNEKPRKAQAIIIENLKKEKHNAIYINELNYEEKIKEIKNGIKQGSTKNN